MAEQLTRVERMIAYLRAHAAEIEAMSAGRVQFDFGKDVSGQVTRFDKLPDEAPRLSA